MGDSLIFNSSYNNPTFENEKYVWRNNKNAIETNWLFVPKAGFKFGKFSIPVISP